jgi:hypothetical protein
VVLRHEGVAEPHSDLMVERKPGGKLMTWRLPVWPITTVTTVTPLELHRREYLTYEGPVSGDRGTVRRVDEGTCLVIGAQVDVWTITFLNKPGRPTLLIQPRPPAQTVASIISA